MSRDNNIRTLRNARASIRPFRIFSTAFQVVALASSKIISSLTHLHCSRASSECTLTNANFIWRAMFECSVSANTAPSKRVNIKGRALAHVRNSSGMKRRGWYLFIFHMRLFNPPRRNIYIRSAAFPKWNIVYSVCAFFVLRDARRGETKVSTREIRQVRYERYIFEDRCGSIFYALFTPWPVHWGSFYSYYFFVFIARRSGS